MLNMLILKLVATPTNNSNVKVYTLTDSVTFSI